jgi:hypothetical protein
MSPVQPGWVHASCPAWVGACLLSSWVGACLLSSLGGCMPPVQFGLVLDQPAVHRGQTEEMNPLCLARVGSLLQFIRNGLLDIVIRIARANSSLQGSHGWFVSLYPARGGGGVAPSVLPGFAGPLCPFFPDRRAILAFIQDIFFVLYQGSCQKKKGKISKSRLAPKVEARCWISILRSMKQFHLSGC